jgi:hypothetical protein
MNIMSDSIPTPPPIPTTPAALPLGSHADEQVAIPSVLSAVEAVLRQPRRVLYQLRQPGQGRLITALLLIAAVCALIYGLVVGTFSGGQQLWAAPTKTAAGLLISAFICLPSLYIFSCLSGSPARLVEVFGLLAGLLTLVTVLLIGFAPVAWVFSQSTESIVAMGVLHLVFWFVATWFGLRFLHAGFAHLSGKSGGALNIWIVIFVLVQLQMMTALRPMIGTAETLLPKEKKFFLTHWVETVEKRNVRSTQEWEKGLQ